MTTQQFLKALDAFERSNKTKTRAPVDVCATYTLVKPILAGILPFLTLIPSVGPRIVAAIKALMAGLDVFCSNR